MVTTFLPYEDFEESARALDPGRLANQPRETFDILVALTQTGAGYQYHPAVLMWRGHLSWLVEYQRAFTRVIDNENAWNWWRQSMSLVEEIDADHMVDPKPPWLGYDRFHRGMKSVLLRKFPEHYWPLFGDIPDDLGYFWPVESHKKTVIDRMTGLVIVEQYGGGPFPH